MKFTAIEDGNTDGHHVLARRETEYTQRCADRSLTALPSANAKDQSSFDPAYDSLPLDFFRDMVRDGFARSRYDPGVIQISVRVPRQVSKVAAARA